MDFASFNWSALIALGGFLFAIYTYRKQSGRANKLRKTEIYQGMEFASNDLFGFEAQNNAVLERFRDARPQEKKFTPVQWKILNRYAEIEEKGAAAVDPSPEFLEAFRKMEEDIRVARKYYEKTLNMFEVAIRFRHEKIVEDKVFGSWVIWYFDTCQEWAFRWMWAKLRKNYMAELRKIFDYPVQYFEFESDSEETLKLLESDFFAHVASVIRCAEVRDWLSNVDGEVTKLHAKVRLDGVDDYPEWPKKYGAAPKITKRHERAPRTVRTAFPGSELSGEAMRDPAG